MRSPLLIFNPFSLDRNRLAICCLTLYFLIVYYGKQGLYTFDDGNVDGIYYLKLNQEDVHMSAGGSALYFRKDTILQA